MDAEAKLMSGVKILAPLPFSYDDIGITSAETNVKNGPCILLYDRRVFAAWDDPQWQRDDRGGRFKPPPTAPLPPCPRCGNEIDCQDAGPGSVAMWSGAQAKTIIDALYRVYEERATQAKWARFMEQADEYDIQEYQGLAEFVVSDKFRGFSRINVLHLYWMDLPAADLPYDHPLNEPRWRAVSREDDLASLIWGLYALGISIPMDTPQPHAADVAAMKASTTKALTKMRAWRQASVDAAARHSLTQHKPPQAWQPEPLSAEEELAISLMGYEHATGEKLPWGPFGRQRSMHGHNHPPSDIETLSETREERA